MWNIDIKQIWDECGKPTARPWKNPFIKETPPKVVKPVSPQDLKRDQIAAIQRCTDEWIVKINTLLRSGYRKYDTTPIALPNEVLEKVNAVYREAGWIVTIIRYDKVLTLEFRERE